MATRPAQLKNIFLGAFCFVMMLSFSACTKKIAFLSSSVVPAARGYVEINADRNKNNIIEIHVTNLAEVQRLQPARQTYVVWMQTDENLIKNIGQIKSSSSMMSKQLKASFETVTSAKPTKIFVTAEDDANTQYAGKQVVLSTKSF